MQVKKSFPEETRAHLTITASEADLNPVKQHVLKRLQQQIKVPGFRAGNVPPGLVEKHVDSAALQNEFLEEAINHLYASAANQLMLKAVSQPQVSIKKFVPFTELEFDVETDVVGEIKLADYKNLKKSKPKAEVTPKDISEVLKSLQTRAAERKEVSRASKPGDEVLIDFNGVNAEGKPVNGADGKDYPLILGSNTFIMDFEPNLVGLKAGADKAFTLKFPKDYGFKAMAGKAVTFEVHINKVQEVIEPKLDDDFVTKISPFKTLGELKNDIKKQLLAERQNELNRQFENELVGAITAKSTVAIPKRLIDEQIDLMERDERQNLAYRGQTWQEHLKEEGVSEQEHREQKRPQALERVKAGLVLSEIAEREKLEVTNEELETRLRLLKEQYKDSAMQAELDKPRNARDIASRILTEKTLDKLTRYATA